MNHFEDEEKDLAQLKNIKAVVKKSQNFKMPDEDYFNQLHDKIMNRVEKEEMQSKVVAFVFQKHIWIRTAAAIVVIVMGIVVWKQVVAPYTNQASPQLAGVQGADLFLSVSKSNPDAFTDSLVTRQQDNDFYIEAASKKLDSLSEKEAKKFFDDLKL